MKLHRNNLFRIFLVLFIVFMLSFLSYYNVWLKADQTITLTAPRNYVFVGNGSQNFTLDREIQGATDVVTYGHGLVVNGLFDITPTAPNETVIGHIYIEKPLGANYSIIHEITVTNLSGIFSTEYNLSQSSYRIAAFEDLYFTGYNYSMESSILSKQPGMNGTILILMPFPQTIFIIMLVSGILSTLSLSYAVIKRKRHLLEL